MQSLEGYNEYIHNCENLIKKLIKTRIIYIQIKQHEFSNINSLIQSKNKKNIEAIKLHIKRIEKIIHKQEKLTQNLKKKKQEIIHYALHNVDNLSINTKAKNHLKKKLHQILVTLTWIYSQSYFLKHQKKNLKSLKKDFRKKYIVIKNKINKIIQRDFYAYLFKEEQELQLSINVFEHRYNYFFTYSKDIKKLEKISSFQKITLKGAIIFNSLPIHGVGDLLSLPFWIAYGVLWGFEHKFSEFKSWNSTKKVTLSHLYEELERIEKTI